MFRRNKSRETALQNNENTLTTSEQVGGGTNNATTARGNMNRRLPTDQPNTSSTTDLYMRPGESGAAPQTSPHLCDETVDLLSSEGEKIVVVGEVHRLETFSLLVQV